MADLYLWRHGKSEDRSLSGKDSERRLVPRGKKEIQTLAHRVLSNNPPLLAIFSSPYARAVETAKVLEEVFRPAAGVEIWSELASGADPERLSDKFAELNALPESFALVGHMPDLSEIANFFLGNPPQKILFEPGGVAKLRIERPGFGAAILEWTLMPSEIVC